MPSIEHVNVEETIMIGDLFDQLEFGSETLPTDESGDSFVPCEWGIEVRSLDTYYPVEGIRWTKPEAQVRLWAQEPGRPAMVSLQCSPEHVVLRQNPCDWVMVKTLRPGDDVVTRYGVYKVREIEPIEDVERLCDLQVAIAHSYFANDILSHNSHFLVQMGAHAVSCGYNVIHYTFELSETVTGVRYDSNFTNISASDVLDSKDAVLKAYSERTGMGQLYIKEYAPNFASIHTIRAHIEKLNLTGFIPDMIIIDYADKMRSTRQFDSIRHELQLIYEELRGLAGELGIPIWTASQANRDSSQSEIVSLENIGEAYAKAQIADVMLTLSRPEQAKATGFGKLFIAKNRAGRDGIVHSVKIDTARSRIEAIVDSTTETLGEARVAESNSIRAALSRRWNEVKVDARKGDLQFKEPDPSAAAQVG